MNAVRLAGRAGCLVVSLCSLVVMAAASPAWAQVRGGARGRLAPGVPAEHVFGNDSIRLVLDQQMNLGVSYDDGGGWQTITRPAPSHIIGLGGAEVEDFALAGVANQPISGQLGSGQRHIASGTADGPMGTTIELELVIDIYDAYPATAFSRATFTNLGTTDLSIDELWGSRLLLDRRLVDDSAASYDFKMLSMGTIWGNGERDRIWDLAAGSTFDNYNGGDVTNPEFTKHWGGGGTPVTSLWCPEMAVTVAVVEPEIRILGVPVHTMADGGVRLGVQETNDLGTLVAGGSVTGSWTSITVHSGDFFEGVAVFGEVMRDLEVIERRETADDYEAYWCSYGVDTWRGENPADRELVESLLYIPEDLGLEWINIDSGWDDTGTCSVNSDAFASEQEFVDWIFDLHDSGFKVSVWLDVGFGGEDVLEDHPEWFIVNQDGSYFVDDWDRHCMDPTVAEVQSFVTDCITKLVTPQDEGGWGVDRLYLDGAFMAPPDYSGRHESPHATELAGDTLYRLVYETARSIDPDFTIECCGSGGVFNMWISRWATNGSVSDPDRMNLRTHELRIKLYKALFGPTAPINGDHIEGTNDEHHFDMDYNFALVLGLGGVFQTFYWEDDWRTADPLGLGDKALYIEWFNRYEQLRLSEGTYLNLYDLAYDSPGSHAIAKDGKIYYLFAPLYGESLVGAVELRGLEAGVSYEVEEYEDQSAHGTVIGPTAELEVEIPVNDPLLLVATPVD